MGGYEGQGVEGKDGGIIRDVSWWVARVEERP